MDIHKQDVRL